MAKVVDLKTKKNPTKKADFLPLGGLFANYQLEDKGGYITQEFQDFGYRMALELDDMKHKSLYMRLAKSEPRAVLEQILSFVKDAANVQSKGRLFMWKLQQIRAERKVKGEQ